MRLLALIDQADVVQRILRHLGLPTEVPAPAPARAPPGLYGTGESEYADDEVTFDPAS